MTANLILGANPHPRRCKLCREPARLRNKVCQDCHDVITEPLPSLVDATPLREAVQRRGVGWSQAAELCGYGRRNTSRLQRDLGVGCRSKRINYDKAVRIARALDIDPVDAGL